MGTNALGWILCAVLLGAAVAWVLSVKPWETSVLPEIPTSEESE